MTDSGTQSCSSRESESELSPAAALSAIVKAYDIRGLVDTQLTSEVVHAVGIAYAEYVAGESSSVVIAHDMRASSPRLAQAMAAGITSVGLDSQSYMWVSHRQTCCISRPAV